MTKGGLSRHLSSCSQRQEATRTANQEPGKEQVIYHLLVRDAWLSDFWLHLEMNGSATLADLDHYLRAIWLECWAPESVFHRRLGRKGDTEEVTGRAGVQAGGRANPYL